MHKNLTAQQTGRIYGAAASGAAAWLTLDGNPPNAGLTDTLLRAAESIALVALVIVGIYSTVVSLGLLLNVATRHAKWAHRHVDMSPEVVFSPVSFSVLVKALLAEIVANIRAFWYLFPWRNETGFLPGASAADAQAPNDTPVVLVHGFMCNAGVWASLRPHLQQRGISTYSVGCDPLGGDIDDFAQEVHKAVQVLKQRTGCARVRLIGHSMGGLIIRAYVKHHGEEDIESAMCLGAPHQGTLYSLGGQGVCAKQMNLGNPWLLALTRSPGDIAFRRKLVNICSTLEDIVQPAAAAALPGARNWMVSHCGHTVMPSDAGVVALIDRWLDEPSASGSMHSKAA